MAYTYLLELYEVIADRRREARQALDDARSGIEAERHRGRVDALEEMDQFLRQGYHGRLPKRVRERLGTP